jgi:hypothetical protein
MSMLFKKAVRSQAKLKLAITGPSGSGKTYSALRLATGLGQKIAVLDTENGSASLYSDQFHFDVVTMEPPFTTERYVQVIDEAVKAGYDVLIIDSLTHAWAGDGGLLEQKESLDSRGKNSFANWGLITKKHEAFKSAILQSQIHIIGTMRSKQEHAQVEENGRKVVKKLGLGPIQREGMEYEFTVVFDVAMNHEAEASKDRTGLFSGKHFKISEDTGKTIAAWMSSAAVIAAPDTTNVVLAGEVKRIVRETEERADHVLDEAHFVDTHPNGLPAITDDRLVTQPQIARLYAIAQAKGFNKDSIVKRVGEKYAKAVKELTRDEYNVICEALENAPVKQS